MGMLFAMPKNKQPAGRTGGLQPDQ